MKCSEWKECKIDIAGVELDFTGDDLDQYSRLVDLGEAYEFLAVFIPTIDSATITPYVQRTAKKSNDPENQPGETGEVPTIVHFWNDNDADTNIAQATVAGTGGIFVVFNIGCAQYVRLKASANQAADRTFYVRGFARGF